MALPPPGQREALKAALKRATDEALGRNLELDDASQEQLRLIYQRAHDDIVARIQGAGGFDGTVGLHRLQQLQLEIDARLRALAVDRNQVLLENMQQAAGSAAGVFQGVVGLGGVSMVADAAVRSAHHFVDADGLQLSDRLWRLDHNARQKVGSAIQQAVVMGHTASKAAEDFLGRGQQPPSDLQAKRQVAQAASIAKQAGAALLKDDAGAYAQAQRVFRTEINRAHSIAYQAAAGRVPGAVGTKFNLSPRHPRRDICDMYAKANLYGLGPGVYPFGKSPYPAHPNTLSYETVVFDDEVTAEHRQGRETALDWLQGQAPGVQVDVLGSQGKAAALRAGHLTNGMIRAPWYSVKKRLERKGVNVEELLNAA